MKVERVLLCRPQGGLNDILCTIERARIYAEKYNRTLFIDTSFANTKYIKDNFSNYFQSKDKNVHLTISSIAHVLCDLTTFPHCVADKIHKYNASFDQGLGNFVEEETQQLISFNFNVDYTEQLLVHHACGGGRLGAAALSRLQLTDRLSDELVRRLSSIGDSYLGIHIRNTDYRSDYKRSLALLKQKLLDMDCKNLFVATDNIECLNYCKSVFPFFKVFSYSALPETAGTPIHYDLDSANKFRTNADAILDVIMLALAKGLFPLPLTPGQLLAYSGFSALANDLRNNRGVLKRLVPNIFANLEFIRSSTTVRAMGTRNAPCPCGSGKRYKHCCGRFGKMTPQVRSGPQSKEPPEPLGPMNGQFARIALTKEIIERCGIARVVETGTYLGTTAEFFASLGLHVVTAEINPIFAARSRERFKVWKNIQLYESDSIQVLKKLIQESDNLLEPTLFYLDAHWEQHLPLREEVELAIANFSKAVLMIDDFNVPGDAGYGFDDYGPGKRLDVKYLRSTNVPNLLLYFPSTPSYRENGHRRGCVVATAAPEIAGILDGIALLRRLI